MGVVKLPEGAMVQLKLSINRKPTNMQQKANKYAIESAVEAKLVQKINKYLFSSHKYGNFGDLVRASAF